MKVGVVGVFLLVLPSPEWTGWDRIGGEESERGGGRCTELLAET